jgi:hypothetical protein
MAGSVYETGAAARVGGRSHPLISGRRLRISRPVDGKRLAMSERITWLSALVCRCDAARGEATR